MGYLSKTIYYNAKNGNGWSSTEIDWTNNAQIESIKTGIGSIKDTFNIKLMNVNNEFFNGTNIDEDGLVRIWMTRDDLPDTTDINDLMIEGTIKQVDESIDWKNRTINIKGFNWLEVLFDNQMPVGIEGQNKTWVEVMRAVLDKVADLSPETLIGTTIRSRKILWDTSNPSTKESGASFPKITYTCNYKPVYEIFEELTTEKYTDDGKYFFYTKTKADGKTYLIVEKKTDVIQGTINEYDTTLEMNDIKITRNKDEIVNFIIYNCGNDLEGKPIENVYYDPISIGKYGFKYKYMINETKDISTTTWTDEYKRKKSSFNANASYTVTPYPTSYNYTWVSEQSFNSQYNPTGSYPTSTSNSDFNDDLVNIVEAKGYRVAEAYAFGTLAPRFDVEITMRWNNQFILGKKYMLNFPSRNLNRPLRLVEIDHTDRQTTLKFEEDEQDRTI